MPEGNGTFGFVGTSECMKEMYRTIAKVAPFDATVLITGREGQEKSLSQGLFTRTAGEAIRHIL